MPLVCPSCGGARLEITESLELPPDSWSDEITVQVVRCSQCAFAGLAVYEESRRGSLDSECFRHQGYACSSAEVARITELIKQCPRPSSNACQCESHQALRRTKDGRWIGLADIEAAESFPMNLVDRGG